MSGIPEEKTKLFSPTACVQVDVIPFPSTWSLIEKYYSSFGPNLGKCPSWTEYSHGTEKGHGCWP